MVEQLICNQQVAGSNPIASSKEIRGVRRRGLPPFFLHGQENRRFAGCGARERHGPKSVSRA